MTGYLVWKPGKRVTQNCQNPETARIWCSFGRKWFMSQDGIFDALKWPLFCGCGWQVCTKRLKILFFISKTRRIQTPRLRWFPRCFQITCSYFGSKVRACWSQLWLYSHSRTSTAHYRPSLLIVPLAILGASLHSFHCFTSLSCHSIFTSWRVNSGKSDDGNEWSKGGSQWSIDERVRGAALWKVGEPIRVESEWSRKDREWSNEQERERERKEWIHAFASKLEQQEWNNRRMSEVRRVHLRGNEDRKSDWNNRRGSQAKRE